MACAGMTDFAALAIFCHLRPRAASFNMKLTDGVHRNHGPVAASLPGSAGACPPPFDRRKDLSELSDRHSGGGRSPECARLRWKRVMSEGKVRRWIPAFAGMTDGVRRNSGGNAWLQRTACAGMTDGVLRKNGGSAWLQRMVCVQ